LALNQHDCVVRDVRIGAWGDGAVQQRRSRFGSATAVTT
jgi:hypothetical protein